MHRNTRPVEILTNVKISIGPVFLYTRLHPYKVVYYVPDIYDGSLTHKWVPQHVGPASMWKTRHICRVQDIPPRILDMRVRKQYDGQPMSLVWRKKNAEVERTEDRVDRKMGPNAQVLESTTQVIKARSYSFSFLIVFLFLFVCLVFFFFFVLFCFLFFEKEEKKNR